MNNSQNYHNHHLNGGQVSGSAVDDSSLHSAISSSMHHQVSGGGMGGVDDTNLYKQQTTRQVTTVTKVVHEVKHFRPDGALVDYVAMPPPTQSSQSTIDRKQLNKNSSDHSDNHQVVDFVALPVNLSSRSNRVQYNHLDNSQQKMYHQDPNQHYQPHYQDYEHYPSQGGLYGSTTGSMDHGQMVGGIPEQYLNEYSSNDNNDHHNSGSPNPGGQLQTSQMHAMIPSSAYLKATSQYDEMPDYRITPSPGGIPSNHRYVSGAGGGGPGDESALLYGYISTPTNPTYASRPYLYNDNIPPGAGLVSLPPGSHGHGTLTRIIDEEQELQKHMSQLSMHSHGQRQLQSAQGHHPGDSFVGMDENQMRWRDPNLSEVIGFLDNPNNIVKANAAAYLQHLCYMDDPNKQRTRSLGGIPPLITLLSNDDPQVHRNACGALRNLSYGRQNDENKRAIKNAGGILALINLLRRTNDSDVKELITGIVWNMSSCEDIKRSIIDDGLIVIVSNVIKPHSGWDQISPGETCWSTVFRNASGVLRNVSSAGEYARTKLRECDGLVDCLLYVVRAAIEKSNIGNKIVENAVCILRNLSYRCQEVEDPNYDKHPIPINQQQTRSSSPKGENLGCFGAGRKKNKDNSSNSSQEQKDFSNAIGNGSASGGMGSRNNSTKSFEMLWQPEVVQSYLTLLQSCSNPETLEAAAGAIQNLAACYWQPSIEIRAAVRKEKGLPILVELLRMEVDRVVCAVATALRNLAIDQRNKELIGKYAMRDLVQKLPSGNPQHDQGTSDDTIAAVLATINEVIKKNAEFSRSLLEAGGVDRLMTITRQRQKYTPCVLKFASQVLFTMWQHTELRDTYKKQGWKEADFVTKTIAARNAAQNSPNNVNNTLNRPMASQGRTRYEDKTLKKNTTGNSTNTGSNQHHGNNMSIAQGGVGSEPLYQKPL